MSGHHRYDGFVVITHTQQELEDKREDLLATLAAIDSFPPREQVVEELANVNFLLGIEDEQV